MAEPYQPRIGGASVSTMGLMPILPSYNGGSIRYNPRTGEAVPGMGAQASGNMYGGGGIDLNIPLGYPGLSSITPSGPFMAGNNLFGGTPEQQAMQRLLMTAPTPMGPGVGRSGYAPLSNAPGYQGLPSYSGGGFQGGSGFGAARPAAPVTSRQPTRTFGPSWGNPLPIAGLPNYGGR